MDDYSNLRALLIGEQQQQLAHLENRLNDPVQRCQEISEILPDALQRNQTVELTSALRSPVTQVVQNDPKTFARAILPVMMPSVRNTVAEAFKTLREFLKEQELKINELNKRSTIVDKQVLPTLQSQLLTFEETLKTLQSLLKNQESQLGELVERSTVVDKQILPVLQSQLKAIESDVKTLPALFTRLQEFEDVRKRFLALETRLNDAEHQTQALANLLPEAIRQATEQAQTAAMSAMKKQAEEEQKNEEKLNETQPAVSFEPDLTESLQEPVTQCIRKSIQNDANVFANALFPIMGPAIRKSINESLKSLVQSINTSVEQSLSPKGIGWRLEALRTGQSFADIVLQNTVVYRVDQVFLIHRETGLLIQHHHREDIEVGDGDAVSGMLTAIQDFTRDSFSSTKDEELDSINVGQFTVWLERGPYAVLACVVRGVAPYKLRATMKEMLEAIHARYGRHLEHFSGDPTLLDGCRSLLSKTLQAELKPEAKKEKKKLFSPTLVVVSLILLGFLGWWSVNAWHISYVQHQQFNLYLETLRQTTGLVVIESNVDKNILKIRGLRDPLAINPHEIAEQQHLSPDIIQAEWSPYQTLAPEFVLKRLQLVLSPPTTVQMHLQNTQLQVKGFADAAWIKAFEQYSQGLIGALQIDSSQLLERDAYLLQQTKTLLQPPPSVQINVKNGNIEMLGHAPNEWLEKQLPNLKNIEGIQLVKKDNLLSTDQHLHQQAVKILAPPANVALQVKNEVLFVQGDVDTKNYQTLIKKIPQLQGFKHIDHSQLVDIETASEQLVQKIEKSQLYFGEEADFVNPEQLAALNTLAQEIQQLFVYNHRLNKTMQLKITGHTDGLGTQRRNLQLSEARAEAIRDKLQTFGLEKKHLIIGTLEKVPFGEAKADLEKRTVTFVVVEKAS
ncbi:MAG: hypothetical protein RIT27_584 [Pseudomonadota bacterium]|jgi:outer membrane protein OmpA-like peptidoglycan-associated protein